MLLIEIVNFIINKLTDLNSDKMGEDEINTLGSNFSFSSFYFLRTFYMTKSLEGYDVLLVVRAEWYITLHQQVILSAAWAKKRITH